MRLWHAAQGAGAPRMPPYCARIFQCRARFPRAGFFPGSAALRVAAQGRNDDLPQGIVQAGHAVQEGAEVVHLLLSGGRRRRRRCRPLLGPCRGAASLEPLARLLVLAKIVARVCLRFVIRADPVLFQLVNQTVVPLLQLRQPLLVVGRLSLQGNIRELCKQAVSGSLVRAL